jgi:hypothetical protein
MRKKTGSADGSSAVNAKRSKKPVAATVGAPGSDKNKRGRDAPATASETLALHNKKIDLHIKCIL